MPKMKENPFSYSSLFLLFITIKKHGSTCFEMAQLCRWWGSTHQAPCALSRSNITSTSVTTTSRSTSCDANDQSGWRQPSQQPTHQKNTQPLRSEYLERRAPKLLLQNASRACLYGRIRPHFGMRSFSRGCGIGHLVTHGVRLSRPRVCMEKVQRHRRLRAFSQIQPPRAKKLLVF